MVQQVLSTNTFTTSKFVVSSTSSQGNYTTIQAAVTAAAAAGGAQTVFILPGAYTENITLSANVNLTAFGSDGLIAGISPSTPNVIILGTTTASFTGSVSLCGITFKTNSAAAIATSGSNSGQLVFNACSVNANDATGMTINNVNIGLNFYNCNFVSSSTNLLFAVTTGTMDFEYCTFSLSATASASTIAVTNVLFNGCDMQGVNITTSSTGSVTVIGCNWGYGGTTLLTTVGTGTSFIYSSSMSSTTASTISVGVGTVLTLSNTAISSSNTNAITGAGTLKYGGVVFTSTSSTVNTTTQTGLPLSVIQGGTGRVTLTNHGVLVGASTSAISQLSAGSAGQVLQSGGASADPAYSTATYPLTAGTSGNLLTSDGTNFTSSTPSNSYTEGTFTPTLIGGTVAGATTYTAQQGYYSRVGNLITVQGYVAISAATGTGNLTLGGLPFTIKNQTNGYPIGNFFWQGSVSWVFPVGGTNLTAVGIFSSTTMLVWAQGTSFAGGFQQMANAALAVAYTLTYQI